MDPLSNPQSILGSTIYGSDGDKLGKAGQVFLDDASGQPEWVTVNTGLFGTKETFVPLRGITTHGDDFAVAYTKEKVKGAPSVDSGDGHISEAEEDSLYEYYGLSGTGGYDTTTTTTTGTAGMATGTTDASGTVGRDTSGPTTDDAMTRSEERLRVGTERVQTGRARLRKYIVSENVTQTVPVTRETVHVEREPITDANRDAAYSGPDLSEEEHEVTLTEERPVVAKETVPVERVRLDKDVETVQQTVSADVRREEIDVTEGEGVRGDRR